MIISAKRDKKLQNFAVLQFCLCAKAACKPCGVWVRSVNQTAKKIFENTAGTVGLARFPSAWRFREDFTRALRREGQGKQKQRRYRRCRCV
ncbi:hypothetical protein DSA70_03195 [Salmonella enterica subsp. enterica]|nr:hypothetical protein [Salmonella enterica subsp. enterica]